MATGLSGMTERRTGAFNAAYRDALTTNSISKGSLALPVTNALRDVERCHARDTVRHDWCE
jgi:hypothetical protein